MKKRVFSILAFSLVLLTACDQSTSTVAEYCGDFPSGPKTGEEGVFMCHDSVGDFCWLRRDYQNQGDDWTAFYDFNGFELDAAETKEFDDAPIDCEPTTQAFFESMVELN